MVKSALFLHYELVTTIMMGVVIKRFTL